ncbi:SDR family NAD(P)-dependent oxidoreductase [Granulicella arctica]|uniref:SDR family NAD(P)-dependent oxidoreductase n=1 Tax=Granulicella arctica TaxID=940613 RepID=UPI0021DFFCDE|nr:SDR family NAD(P)-dependent oxidoreductase [Granulicella arctica]
MSTSPLAVITGSSSGIGLELAKLAANDGYSLILAADTPFDDAITQITSHNVQTLNADLSTSNGIAELVTLVGDRQVDVLCANAGHGLGKAFLDEDFQAIRGVIGTNITGTLELLHAVAGRMQARGTGRILLTGSMAGFMPGAYQAVYNASKAFINNFSYALRNELKDSGVTVTCLMPSVTDTEFWERGGTLDTKAGSGEKGSPDKPALAGWEAMKAGKDEVSPGLGHTIEKAALKVMPAEIAAEMNAKDLKPRPAR